MRVRADALSLGFGERILFTDLRLDIPHRGVTALVGPSGSGKSSLLAALAGFLSPAAGWVAMIGDDGIPTLPDARHVTWIPQGSNAIPARSVLDNAMIGALARGASLDDARARATASLAELGIAHRAHAAARELSGGELQRLAFARAATAATPFVFADEPTASLDAANVHRVVDLLVGLGTRASVVVATHDPAVIAGADVVVRLRT